MIEPTDEMVQLIYERGVARDEIRAGLAAVLDLAERQWQEQCGDPLAAGFRRAEYELCPRCGVELEHEVAEEREEPCQWCGTPPGHRYLSTGCLLHRCGRGQDAGPVQVLRRPVSLPLRSSGGVVIEPTEEMIRAHETARRAYWDSLDYAAGVNVAEHEPRAARKAMEAALAIVERDYVVKPRGEDCLCGADLGPPWDSVPHRKGTPGCRRAEAKPERPEMLSDRLGYPASVGDEDWQRIEDREGGPS